jgi:LuxR family maltose regulon positive regulatory protein
VRERALAAGRGLVVLETLILEALATARKGTALQAHELLATALELAAPEACWGLFADMGTPLAKLLAQHLASRAADDPLRPFLEWLLTRPVADTAHAAEPALQHRASTAARGADALTQREREVLELFAAGMTSAEIAQHFVVSINTVKTQLKSIYGKLDAHSRAEVIGRARGLGLIP